MRHLCIQSAVQCNETGDEESTTVVNWLFVFLFAVQFEVQSQSHTRLIKTQWPTIDSRLCLFIFALGLFLPAILCLCVTSGL